MTDLHRYIAYSIPAGFAVMVLWALYSFVRNRAPNDLFWNLLAVLQVVIGIQIIVGGILFIGGGRPDTNGPEWLHYVSGGLFPGAVLVITHGFARSERFRGIPWLPFGVAALVCFGLTFRALQTGLGVD